MTKKRSILRALIALSVSTHCVSAKELSDYLARAEFQQGAVHFTEMKARGEASNQDIFSLGVLRFLDSLETLTQDFYRLGLDSRFGQQVGVPFLRLPVPVNPAPEQATPQAIREAFERFHSNLESVNLVLQDLDEADFHVPIDIASIRFDIDDDGDFQDYESFHRIYTTYNRRAVELFRDGASVVVDFDRADAYWLKGYSHLLLALTDVILAHDWSDVYERAAHVAFGSVDSEAGSVFKAQKEVRFALWADLIAGVHAMHLQVTDPERLKSAHRELLQTVQCSRLTWGYIEKETDDQNEWIPGTQQTGVTGAQINREMIDGWTAFLDEFEAVLEGDKLVPHWRILDGRGINLKRVFHEPRPFDLIYWLQGSAVFPYLEAGELSTQETWRRITSTFRGNFIGFAIWVN